MNNKSKLIVIVSATIILVLAVIAFRAISSLSVQRKKYAEQEQKYQKSIDTLNVSLSQSKVNLKNAENKLIDIQKEIAAISGEHDTLKNQYAAALGEKENLSGKIATLENVLKKKQTIKQEIPPISSDSYWAGVLENKARLEVEVGSLQKQIGVLNTKLDDLTKQNNDLTVDLSKVNQDKLELGRKIEYSESVPKMLSEQLVKEKNERMALSEEADKITKSYSILKQQLKDEAIEKLKLTGQMQDLMKERGSLTRRIAELEETLQDRTAEIVEIREQLTFLPSESVRPLSEGSRAVELAPIIVQAGIRQSQQPEPEKVLSGSILAANKENNFVVVDIGESAGVKKGMVFSVYRGDAQVGTIEVIQVRRDISAADIKSSSGQPIKVGDIIRAR